jgi:glucose-1-phosphate cytidylyltransferase
MAFTTSNAASHERGPGIRKGAAGAALRKKVVLSQAAHAAAAHGKEAVMKVVLFCGGLGMRIRDAENLPKPMVHIGYRPLLWHVMKYYAHFGHTDFLLCLGHRADAIKDYFLRYNECASNDFVLSGGGKNVELLNRDIQDWRITFADTGIHSNIGQRLKAVEKHLQGEEEFLANYSDGLTDLPLPGQLEFFRRQDKIACFLCVKPTLSYHVISLEEGSSLVSDIRPISNGDLRINGGYFIFKREIFDYIRDKEELVEEPFHRLVANRQLAGYVYDGFWASMDTFKDKQQLEQLYSSGAAPWEVWKSNNRLKAA